jgi:hypothetical protein
MFASQAHRFRKLAPTLWLCRLLLSQISPELQEICTLLKGGLLLFVMLIHLGAMLLFTTSRTTGSLLIHLAAMLPFTTSRTTGSLPTCEVCITLFVRLLDKHQVCFAEW